MSDGEAPGMTSDAIVAIGIATGGASRSRESILDVPLTRSRGASVIAGVGTVGVHLGLVALALVIGTRVARQAKEPAVTLMDVELLPAPPPPPPAIEPVPPRDPVPVRPRARPPEATRAAPPPAAAQAGKVSTAADEIVDFGDTVVVGKSESYAGGTTEAGGTAKHAVHDTRARAGGVEGGTGTDVRGDRSRAPQLAGGMEWDCPFPQEADDLGIDHAVVTLRVEVAVDGRVIGTAATNGTENGFGREARRCAMSKRWSPGLDRAGNAIGAVALVNVRFDR